MPRLTLLFEYPTLSGGERSLMAVLPSVQAAGFEALAIAPGDGPLAHALRETNVEVVPFEFHGDGGQRLPSAMLRARLQEELVRVRTRLVHANSLSASRVSGPVVGDLRLPSIGHLRDIVGLTASAVADLSHHTRLIAVSRAVRDHHVAQGLDPGRTFVVYNGVDLDQFRPRASTGWLHRELGLPPDAPLIAAIGQIALRKGLDIFAEVAERLAAVIPSARFLIVGDRFSSKQESLDLEQRLRRAAITSHSPSILDPPQLLLLGERLDIDRILPELTLLLHTARQEPLGRVLLEAAACGLPIVATDVGGTREIFPPEEHAAVLVPRDDVDAMTVSVADLIADADRRHSLGVAARRRAETAFGIAQAAESLLAQYRAVL